MKILYVARHDQVMTSNDDEGAIAYALRVLGHEVHCVHEQMPNIEADESFDFCLFHKWNRWQDMDRLSRQVPLVFWYFDLVNYPDPTLRRRCQMRMDWMSLATPLVTVGFCTDGDWVSRDTTGKLNWLTQGADERVVGRGVQRTPSRISLLFSGTYKGGERRQSFVDEVASRYKGRFCHVSQGVYRRHMADLIASSDIVLAPDSPVTNRYWSNRVYNVLGFGGFLLHPWAGQLYNHYNDSHLVYYQTRNRLWEAIEHYLSRPTVRAEVSEAGLEHTKRFHLYRHSLESMLATVKEVL